MKDVLVHLQTNMQEDLGSGNPTAPANHEAPDQNFNEQVYNKHLSNIQSYWSAFEPVQPKNRTTHPSRTCEYQQNHEDVRSILQELNIQRARILNDMENEEKDHQWFQSELDRIRQEMQKLPVTDNYPYSHDVVRKQLEQEARQLQEAMLQKLGSSNDICQRYEDRMHSLQLIDKETMKLQEQNQKTDDYPRPFERSNSKSLSANGSIPKAQSMSLCTKDIETEINEDSASAMSSSSTMKPNSKMTTSATQTSIDLYPAEGTPVSALGLSNSATLSSIYHGTWPMDRIALWHSGPSSIGEMNNSYHSVGNQDTSSVMSFTSSMVSTSSRRSTHTQQLGTKVEMVYSLLSMLGSHDKDEMSKTLLAMSSSRESCVAMRQSGCLPLLIQMLHCNDKDGPEGDRRSSREARLRASQALHNIVHAHPDDKRGRREARVLRLLEQIRDYCDGLRDSEMHNCDEDHVAGSNNLEQHPGPSMAALMKLSFDEEHRHAMCQLGGLQAIAELIEVDYEVHGNTSGQYCVTLRRYAGMALTNLTFGDGTNKALLCSMKSFMTALVAQLHSPSEDLRQVVASVLRNLSWRADPASKKTLREVGAVTTLMKAAMEAKKESTLKSILSALWNLSAHCSMNKADICAVDGALGFLVSTLTYKSASKTLAIIENGGGILRNISSQIAVREDYRSILRQHNCLHILLQHLRSPSLTIVSNACGTLWNLSARCQEDQRALWDMGAVSMLRNLVHSKHKMISMGSSAALKNLLASRPPGVSITSATSPANANGDGLNKSNIPSLHVRKQRALEAEIDQTLSETYDNIDSPKSSPTHRLDNDHRYLFTENHSHYPILMLHGRMYHSIGGHIPVPAKNVSRSDSKDSISSTQSDTSHDRMHGMNMHYRNQKYSGSIHDQRQQNTVNHFLTNNTNSNDMNTSFRSHLTASRIAQVMQEVVKHVALEDTHITTCNSPDFKVMYTKSGKGIHETNPDSNVSPNCQATNEHLNSVQETNNSRGYSKSGKFIYDKYSNLTTKIDNLNLDDRDLDDQPINYSLKYSEDISNIQVNKISSDEQQSRPPPKIDNYLNDKTHKEKLSQSEHSRQFTSKRSNVEKQDTNSFGRNKNFNSSLKSKNSNKNNSDLYSTYAETDLDNPDQPTNYSLLYTEDNDESDHFRVPAPRDESNYYSHEFASKEPSIHDDTLKTYCTEGTPLNFSTANSMTDLRDTANKEKGDITAIKSEGATDSEMKHKSEGQIVITEEDEEESQTDLPIDSNISSGILTPDKVVTYCVEGTPASFSRVSSLSSLNSNDLTDQPVSNTRPPLQSIKESDGDNSAVAQEKAKVSAVPELESALPPEDDCGIKSESEKEASKVEKNASSKVGPASQEKEVVTKSVTFGEDNYAEETPLMFSRCSSLGSLSSFDQHSIHDDRSSIISDFSRRASEVVSPSDLPDSPSQTMPPSPRHTKSNVEFPSESSESKSKKSVFEDTVKAFCSEETPAGFSSATSLSSLVIDDEIEDDAPVTKETNLLEQNSFNEECANQEDRVEFHENDKKIDQAPVQSDDSPSSVEDQKFLESDSTEKQDSKDDIESFSETEENEEDILAACISSAMPNNSKQNKRKYNNTKLSSKVNKISMPPRTGPSNIPIKANNLRHVRPQLNAASGISTGKQLNIQPLSNGFCSEDTVKTYNVEDTPANLSSAASLSEISGLDFSDSSKPRSRNELANDSNSDNSSFGDDLMLAQCIQSGMPKGRSQSKMSNNSNDGDKASMTEKVGLKQHINHSFSPSPLIRNKVSKNTNFQCDEVITYAEEGTPRHFSNGSSLSDLTVDSTEPCRFKPMENPAVNRTSRVDSKPVKMNNLSQENYFSSAMPPTSDSHHLYTVEGTPIVFSRNDSLSSLSCEEDAELANDKKQLKIKNIDTNKAAGKNNTAGGRSRSLPVMRSNFGSVNTPGFTSGIPVPQGRIQRKSYTAVNSSCIPSTVKNKNENPPRDLNGNDEQRLTFRVEDTPLCLSRNSSLSSLSVESLSVEPSASDQALLEECINSGMPKNKSFLEKRRSPKNKAKDYEANQHKDKKNEQNRSREGLGSPEGAHKIETSTKSDLNQKNEHNTILSQAGSMFTCQNEELQEKAESSIFSQVFEADSYIGDAEKLTVSEPNHLDLKEKIGTNMIDSKLLEIEASKLANEMCIEAEKITDSMEQSNTSSDLDNIKPPSVMSDLPSLSCSMVSSAASDSLGERRPSLDSDMKSSRPIDIMVQNCKRACSSLPRSSEPQKLKSVPELVLRALGGNPDASKASSPSEIVDRPPSGMDSVENLSMRSSCTSDLENIKPPSILEDVDMTSSTYSVASISSEIAETKSEVPSMKGSNNSEMFECIKPVIAMAELYAREGMMAGSMKSSCNSDFIENINPPSLFQDFTECNSTTDDVTATLGSDTDTDNELPDDTIPGRTTAADKNQANCRNMINKLSKASHFVQNTQILATAAEEKHDNELDITPEEVQALRENANLVVSTLNEIKNDISNEECSLVEDMFIECETLSLVSNESESSHTNSDPSNDNAETITIQRGPRIVKPVDRNIVKQNVPSENGPKPIRGKRKALYAPRQQSSSPSARSSSPKSKDTAVKPTRTSVLRANQSLQKVNSPVKPIEKATGIQKKVPSKTSEPTITPKINKVNAVAKPAVSSKDNAKESDDTETQELEDDENRPKPPVKQGTFTKDKPSQNSPPKISPTKIKPPVIFKTNVDGKPPKHSSQDFKENSPLNRNNASDGKISTNCGGSSSPKGRSRLLQSRSLDEKSPSSSNGSTNPGSRTPSAGSQIKGRRIQSPSPMNRNVSSSLSNLKKGSNTPGLKNSLSNQSLGGRRTPNSGLTSRSGSGTLSAGKRSSSNVSLCSNNSSTTNTTNSSKKASASNPGKKEVVSKVAALWKKSDKDANQQKAKTGTKVSSEGPVRVQGLVRSSTYEKLPQDNDEQKSSHCIRSEDKNQINNKTFTKSPSVDSKLGSFASDQDDKSQEEVEVWIRRDELSPSEDNKVVDPGRPPIVQRPKAIEGLSSNLSTESSKTTFTRTERSPLAEVKTSPASAIVPPFNYNPNAAKAVAQQRSLIPTPTKTAPQSVRRRDSYINSIESEVSEEPKRAACMITTV